MYLMSAGKSYKKYQKCTFNKNLGKISPQSLLSLLGSKRSRPPFEKPQEIPHYMFWERKRKRERERER
jgi:hypothetical protein